MTTSTTAMVLFGTVPNSWSFELLLAPLAGCKRGLVGLLAAFERDLDLLLLLGGLGLSDTTG